MTSSILDSKLRQGRNPADNPPAYSDYGSIHGQRCPPVHPSQPSTRALKARDRYPAPSVDQVHIFERKHDIKGTFYIDPTVPALDQSYRKSKGKSRQPLPHASFRARNSNITLDLATTGSVFEAPKANIAVSSRAGDININLLPMPPSRPRIGLDVHSRRGNIALFLPEGFAGVVHMTTGKGGLDVLPALAASIKIVKTSEQEVIFMIGARNDVDDNSREASFCQLGSRTGRIIVGLSGRDHYSPQKGFWKRLGGYFGARKDTANACS